MEWNAGANRARRSPGPRRRLIRSCSALSGGRAELRAKSPGRQTVRVSWVSWVPWVPGSRGSRGSPGSHVCPPMTRIDRGQHASPVVDSCPASPAEALTTRRSVDPSPHRPRRMGDRITFGECVFGTRHVVGVPTFQKSACGDRRGSVGMDGRTEGAMGAKCAKCVKCAEGAADRGKDRRGDGSDEGFEGRPAAGFCGKPLQG
jgi:hypothetical protein